MKEYIKAARNTGWLLIASFFSRILTAVFIILLANYLLPEAFGLYNFAMAVGFIVAAGTDLGFDALAVREISKDISKTPRMTSDLLVLRTLLGIGCLIFLLLLYHMFITRFRTGLDLLILLTVGGMLIVERISGTFLAVFQAHQRMELQAVVSIIWKVLYLTLGILGILLGFDLLYILLLLLVSYLSRLVFSFIFYRSFLGERFKVPKTSDFPSLLSNVSPFTLFTVLNMVYGHLIIILLALLLGAYSTGVYSASWKIIVFLGVIPHAFGRALYPLFSRQFSSEKKALSKTYKHSIHYLLIISLPLTLGLYVSAPDILSFIFRAQYSPTTEVFRTLVWILPFLFMNGSLRMVLWSSEQTVASSKNIGIAALVLAALGAALIPFIGVEGAAMAVVIAEIVHFLANYHVVTAKYGPVKLSDLWKPYLSSVVMAVFLYLSRHITEIYWVLWSIPLGIVIYFAFLFLIGGAQMKDVRLIKRVMRRGEL